MTSSSQWTTLGAIARKDGYGLVDGPFGSNLPASLYVSSGVPVIRGSNLSLGKDRFQSDEFVYVSQETAQRLERSLCEPNDIVFTKKGTLGQTGIIPSTLPYKKYLLSSNQMKLSVDLEIADPQFVYYYVSSPASREKIIRDSEVTGVPKTNVAYLRQFPILLLPLPVQRRIAAILSALDDKIECNRRINQTLEAMAQALYKHWFVDFGPFRGGEPALSGAEGFVESELGEIPQGWGVGKLDDLLVLQRGFDLPSQERVSGIYPILAASGFSGYHKEYKVKGPGVTTGRSGVLGKVFFVHEDFWPLNTSLWIREYRASCPVHAYFLLQTLNFEAFNAGSAVPTLNRNHVHSIAVVVPPTSLIKTFEEFVMPMFRLIRQNEKESLDLARTRNYLLPKLLLGEVEVKAEVAIG